MKKVIYKTVIEVEVLSEQPIPDGMPLQYIAEQGYDGDYSVVSEIKSAEPITGKDASDATINQGSDPEFFGMDEDGNEIE